MTIRAGRRRAVARPRPSRTPFLLTYFGITCGLCTLLAGWKGLLIAPCLILWATILAFTHRRRRSVVGLLMDEGDEDFERMRRAQVARRRARDGQAKPEDR